MLSDDPVSCSQMLIDALILKVACAALHQQHIPTGSGEEKWA